MWGMARRCRWAAVALFAIAAQPVSALAQLSIYAEEPLVSAVKNNDAAGAVRALFKGESPNQRDSMGIPALALAAQFGDEKTVTVLLQHGAAIDLTDNAGNAPLAHAAARGHIEVLRLLLAAKPRIDRENRQGETPLMMAAKNGHYDVVRELIRVGAAVNGHTPYWHARVNRHTRVVRLLQEHGGKE
jgi:ankyrin repeat protein